MTNLAFDQSLAQQIYNSSYLYPVNLDDAWQWLGYNQKSDALSKLKNHFDDDIDFSAKTLKTSNGGRPRTCVMLSIDCFKSLAMMAGTDQGKVIRKYFLECERIAKQIALQQQPPAKALPSEYDLKLKNIRDRKNAATKDIHELQVQIDELHGIWQALDSEEDDLILEKNKSIIDDGIQRRAKVEKRKRLKGQEFEDIISKPWGDDTK